MIQTAAGDWVNVYTEFIKLVHVNIIPGCETKLYSIIRGQGLKKLSPFLIQLWLIWLVPTNRKNICKIWRHYILYFYMKMWQSKFIHKKYAVCGIKYNIKSLIHFLFGFLTNVFHWNALLIFSLICFYYFFLDLI